MDTQNSYNVMLAKMRAFRATKTVIATALKPFDITIMQWLFLGVIAKQSSTTAMNVAQELQVSMPLVTRFSKQLLEKNLISIEPDNNDKRTKHITLLAAGNNLLEETEPIVRGALKTWLEEVPREHVAVYIKVLLQVAYKA